MLNLLVKLRHCAPLLIACSSLFGSLPAHAAEDGVIGPSSSGYFRLELIIEEGIRIVNLDDVRVVTQQDQSTEQITAIEEFCITGRRGASYVIQAWTTAIVDGRFALSSITGQLIPFTVEFSPSIGTNEFDVLQPNSLTTPYNASSFSDCDAGNNSQIKVVFDTADVQDTDSSSYSGDLFLVVELN